MRWARWEVCATGHTDSGTSSGEAGTARRVGSGIGSLRAGEHQHIGMHGELRALAAGHAGAERAPPTGGHARPELPCLDRGQQRDDVLEVGHPSLRSEEHTSELQSRVDLVCRLLLEKKKK